MIQVTSSANCIQEVTLDICTEAVSVVQGWQGGRGLLLGWVHAKGVAVRLTHRECLSVYFSHFGDQLIADLGEFLDLLIL